MKRWCSRILLGGLAMAGAAAALWAGPTVSRSSPARNVLTPGQDAVLSVSASGSGALSYQWRHRGGPIAGGTGSTLSVSSAVMGDAGWYVVDVTDSTGTTRSEPFFVIVAPSVSRVRSWGDASLTAYNYYHGATNFVALVAKYRDALALTADGYVSGWGETNYQFGVPGELTEVVDVAVGGHHNAVLQSDGTVVVWGSGAEGQLNQPEGLSHVVGLAASSYETIALKSDGSLVAWGGAADGITTIPPEATGVTAIAAGDGHALALKSDGTVVAWGYNFDGQCNVPVGLTGVVAIAAGDAHSVALKSDGTVVAWGRAAKGAVNVPAGLANVMAISAGGEHSLALKADGSVIAWGSNLYGESTVPNNLGPVRAVAGGASVSYALDDGSVPITAPSVNQQPISTVLVSGQSATFHVNASGTTLSYRWQVLYVDSYGSQWLFLEGDNGGFYSGVQTSTLTVTGNAIGGPTQYRCVIVNDAGIATTLAVTLTPLSTPSGVVQISAGSNTSFWVTSDGHLWSLAGGSAPVLVATDVVRSFAGFDHNLFLKSDRTLWAMGENSYGQLGDDTTTTRTTPVQVASDVVSFAAGFKHSAIVKSDVSLWCVGYNGSGELGDGTTVSQSSFVQVLSSGVVGVTARNNTTFFLKADGTLWGVGANSDGLFGNGTANGTSVPVQLAAGVKQISAGLGHSLQLRTDGEMWAAGANSSGALGDGTTDARLSSVRVASDVRAIAAGYQHSLFITNDGVLWGAGTSSSGELGQGTPTNRSSAVQIATNVVAAAAGYSRSFFLKADGVLWATGANPLGDTIAYSRLAPVAVSGSGAALPAAVSQVDANVSESGRVVLGWLPAVGAATYEIWRSAPGQTTVTTKIGETTDAIFSDVTATAGSDFSYAIKSRNVSGVSAFSSVIQAQATPLAPVVLTQPVPAVARIGSTARFRVDVAANPAASYQWQARPVAGSWNDISDNAMIHGSQSGAVEITSISQAQDQLELRCVIQNAAGSVTTDAARLHVDRAVARVSAGTYHGMFVRNDSKLWVTGAAATYQMGVMVGGARRPRPTGIEVFDVAAGASHSLFVSTDHTLWAVGDNFYGQLGDGTTTYRSTPVQVATDVVAASANSSHSLFIKSDGTLWAMGLNTFGELGDGTATQRPTPVQIASGVASVSAGSFYSLFVKTDGTLWAMGRNYSGNLGDGTTTHRYSPVLIAHNVVSASAGEDHSLFVKTDGTLWAMGYSGSGRLGLSNGTTYYLVPTQVATNVSAATAGSDYSLFIKTDGTLWGMGSNVNGQLGLGLTAITITPMFIAAGITSVDAGNMFTMYTRTDGSLWAMGWNLDGEVGDGTTTTRRVPVLIAGGDIPVFSTQPADLTMSVNSMATFACTAESSMQLSYQWRKGGVPIAGATAASYAITSVNFSDAGSYDVLVSNAAGSVLSNPAILTVAPNYSSWQQTKFAAGELADANISGPNADPDHDGLPNLLEYALGLEPKAVQQSGQPSVSVQGSDWVYTYTRPSDRPGLVYAVEMSANLTSWTTAGVVHELVSAGGGTETWRAKYPVGSAANCYFRLKITQP